MHFKSIQNSEKAVWEWTIPPPQKNPGNNLPLELSPKMYLHKDMFSEV